MQKGKTKQRTNETNGNMIDFDLNILIITLDTNGLTISIIRQVQSDWIKKKQD